MDSGQDVLEQYFAKTNNQSDASLILVDIANEARKRNISFEEYVRCVWGVNLYSTRDILALDYYRRFAWKDWYGRCYIQSPHWKELREYLYNLYNGVCRECRQQFKKHQMNVHHHHYQSLWYECVEDVALLCIDCHKSHHRRRRRARRRFQ